MVNTRNWKRICIDWRFHGNVSYFRNLLGICRSSSQERGSHAGMIRYLVTSPLRAQERRSLLDQSLIVDILFYRICSWKKMSFEPSLLHLDGKSSQLLTNIFASLSSYIFIFIDTKFVVPQRARRRVVWKDRGFFMSFHITHAQVPQSLRSLCFHDIGSPREETT